MGVNIENCVNTGVITSEWESEAMTTSMGNDSGNKNCYYLEGTAVDGNGATAKTAERSGQDCFIVAAYDENGALVSLNYIKADLPTGTSFSCGVNIPKTDEPIETIKAFVWNGLDTMAPLAKSVEYTK